MMFDDTKSSRSKKFIPNILKPASGPNDRELRLLSKATAIP